MEAIIIMAIPIITITVIPITTITMAGTGIHIEKHNWVRKSGRGINQAFFIEKDRLCYNVSTQRLTFFKRSRIYPCTQLV